METDITHPFSKNKLWVFHKNISHLYFSDNDSKKENTIDKTIAFLEAAKKQAKKLGFEDIVVQGYTEEGDCNNLATNHIRVYGRRLETDKEYKERQESIIYGKKKAFENYQKSKKFYESAEGTIQLRELGFF